MPKEKVLLKFSIRKRTIYDDLTDSLPKSLEFFQLPPGRSVLNHDLCDACGESGMFVCCDSCPKSFHFSCTNPPMHPESIPEDDWYCGECRVYEGDPEICNFGYRLSARKVSCNGKTVSAEESPLLPLESTLFQLSTDNFLPFEPCFENKNVQIFSLPALPVPKEPEVTVPIDNSGLRFAQCHKCGLSEMHGPMAKCSECPLAWHFDCLDPPICALPSKSQSEWLCPIHIDHFVELPPKRARKAQAPRRALSAWDWNDGNVDIVIESPYSQSSGLLSDLAVRFRLAAKLSNLRDQ